MPNWKEEPPTLIREAPLNKKNEDLHYLPSARSVSRISIVASCLIALDIAKCEFSETFRVKILQVFLAIPVSVNYTIIILYFIIYLSHLCRLMYNQSRDHDETGWRDIQVLLLNNPATIDCNRCWWILMETGRLPSIAIVNTRWFTRYSKVSFIGVGNVRCLLFASKMSLRCDV
jgi:hypothetical protein